MAGTWSGTRAVVGGFDSDGANNRELLRVRTDGSVEHLIYTSLFIAPRITVLAPAGALGGAAN